MIASHSFLSTPVRFGAIQLTTSEPAAARKDLGQSAMPAAILARCALEYDAGKSASRAQAVSWRTA
eukprot:1909885-Prymnesium_polylepis.3